MRSIFILCLALIFSQLSYAQSGRWQQRVKYTMDINVDVAGNRFTGKQKLEYFNNSPDTLKRVFYHLYWNAFQPNSMMDARSLHMGNIRNNGRPEWDGRVKDRISSIKEKEIGSQKVSSLTINGVQQKLIEHETILEVQLAKPILPRSKTILVMDFKTQVPLQIRRSGFDAANGVQFSMSQWYPKICEYDREGWHPSPYIAREFYGVWGDYDVKITIDKNYILGATGYLQHPETIGYGYEGSAKLMRPAGNKITWQFIAPNVHDFVWAADTGYKHLVRKITNGPEIHVLYKSGEEVQWENVARAAVAVYPYIIRNFGAYPYKQYSFIQGGDGGMEYPMATLLSGPGIGTVVHEWVHSWYQMMLGTNESMYAWMDEGFTEFATDLVQEYYRDSLASLKNGTNKLNILTENSAVALLPLNHNDNYKSYYFIAKSGLEEPLTTHADHFNTNVAYSIAAYSKGAVFMEQLGYIIGAPVRDKLLLEYYRQWAFKHPNAADLVKLAENISGLQLDWYKEYWCNTTKTIDYAIDSLWEEEGASKVRLRRIGQMPMPIDLQLSFKDGSTLQYTIPLNLMYGAKAAETSLPVIVLEEWRWTHPTYIVTFKQRLATLLKAEIDPSRRMADTDQKNNVLEIKW